MGLRGIVTTGATTTLALAAAFPLELVNYFVIGYPAGTHLTIHKDWFAAIAAQWYLLHLPGIFAVNALELLRTYRGLGSMVIFLCGWFDTALLLTICIWPIQLLLRALKRPLRPLKTGP